MTHELKYPGKFLSRFKENLDYIMIFGLHKLQIGRMIGASKSTYCQEHQDDFILFNANVLTKKSGKVWYGDLNVTKDFNKLKNVADNLDEDLYILYEMDARFEHENESTKKLIKKAKAIIKCKTKKEKKNGTDSRSTQRSLFT